MRRLPDVDSHPRTAYFVGAVLVLSIYWVLGSAGLAVAAPLQQGVGAIWPPSGLAVAVVLLFGYRYVPVVFVGALLVSLQTDAGVPVAAGIAAGYGLEALLAAGLIRRFAGPRVDIRHLRDVACLALLGAGVGATAGASIGVTSLWAGRMIPAPDLGLWLNWWAGDMVGVLVLTPFLLAVGEPETHPFRKAYYIEAAGIMLATAVIAGLVFGPGFLFPQGYPLAFMLLPLIVWAAVRYEVRGATAVTLLLAAASAYGTIRGHGPFTLLPAAQGMLLLALFISVTAITGLLVAASTSERREAGALREGLGLLQQVMELLPVGVWVADGDARISNRNRAAVHMERGADSGQAYLGWGEGNGKRLDQRDMPLARVLATGEPCVENQIEMRAGAGSRQMLLSSAMPLRDSERRLIGAVLVQQDMTDLLRTEESLRELAAIVEQTDDIVCVTNRSGSIEYVNPSFEKATGYARDEVLGRTPAVLKSGRQDRSFYQRLWTTIDAGRPFREVMVNRRKSGELYIEAKTITPIRNRSGVITHFVSTGKDISERTQAEAERKQLLDVLEASLNEIYIFDPDTLRFRYVNKAALGNLGYSAEAMNALTPLDLKPELDADAFRQLIAPLLSGDQDQTVFQTVHRRADASLYPVEVHLQMAGQKAQRVFLAVIFDVTERRRAEQALRGNERKLQALMANLPGMAYRCLNDPDRMLEFVSDGCVDLTGYRPADFVETRAIHYADLIHADDREPVLDAVQLALAGRRPFELTYRIRTVAGEEKWVWERGQGAFSAAGELQFLEGFVTDVSVRKRAEEALRTNDERLRQLSRSLFAAEEDQRRLLARELHDRVGQNVTALALNLNLVRGELPAESLQKVSVRLGDCETLLDQTAQLIRDVMADLRPPGLDELGLAAALNEHAREVSARSGFSVTVRGVAPRLPPAVEITLFRIAQEALTNVAKHARATEVSLALEAGPDTVRLTIADNGRGFDPAARPERPSANLGMVGMRERAEAIGARLRIESAPGQGTRVIVEAPCAASSPAQSGLFS